MVTLFVVLGLLCAMFAAVMFAALVLAARADRAALASVRAPYLVRDCSGQTFEKH